MYTHAHRPHTWTDNEKVTRTLEKRNTNFHQFKKLNYVTFYRHSFSSVKASVSNLWCCCVFFLSLFIEYLGSKYLLEYSIPSSSLFFATSSVHQRIHTRDIFSHFRCIPFLTQNWKQHKKTHTHTQENIFCCTKVEREYPGIFRFLSLVFFLFSFCLHFCLQSEYN